MASQRERAYELAGFVYVVIKDCIERYSTEHGIEITISDAEAIAGTRNVLTDIIDRRYADYRKAVLEECAKIAERKYISGNQQYAETIATAIRSRAKEK